ncbi:MAG: TIGR01620 family protein [Epsilonproteobacteria bacterium]|nr:TIGR01620 family protein [Campylobacterota bacterium]
MNEIKPGRVEEKAILKEVEQEEQKRLTKLKGISGFAKKSLILASLLASLIVIGTIYDAAFTASSMLTAMPFLGVIYLILLFAFIGILGYTLIKQYLGYVKLKRIDALQQEGVTFIKHPTAEVKVYALKIVKQYKMHEDPLIRKNIEQLERELGTLMASEVIERIDELLLNPLDKKAKSIIVNYSTQTAVSTAISPVALIDAILIISRSYAMINEISRLYGYKPNFIGEMALVRNVFINLAFASVTELLTHHSSDIVGSTMLSKLSMHSAQGVANGVLTARVGLGTIRAVRPIVYKDKNEGFLKNITKSIIDKIFNNKSQN